MNPETVADQAAHHPDPATGAVAPPIYLSTTFERDPDGEYSRGFVYSRSDNPKRANTNATTIMIGERVAEFIKAGV